MAKDPMKKAFDIVRGKPDQFKVNPVAIRMKARSEAKDLERSLGKGHVPDVMRRDKKGSTTRVYGIRDSKNLLDHRAHLEEIGGRFNK